MRFSSFSESKRQLQSAWDLPIATQGPYASTSAPPLTSARLWQNTTMQINPYVFRDNVSMYAKHGHQSNLRRPSWWLQSRQPFVNTELNQRASRLFVPGDTFGTTNVWRGRFGMESWSKRPLGLKIGHLTLQPKLLQSAVGSAHGAPLQMREPRKWKGQSSGCGDCMRNCQRVWPWRLAPISEERVMG
eukprot:6461882-Amphidinium_carterae.1